MGGCSSINVTFPRTLQALGIPLTVLYESDSPFFDIFSIDEEYPLDRIGNTVLSRRLALVRVLGVIHHG